MRLRALASIGMSLCTVSLAAQVSDARLERAVERIERNDVNGLRRLLGGSVAGAADRGRRAAALAMDAPAQGHGRHGVTRRRQRARSTRARTINARDNEGNTPLHFAVKRINREKFPTRDYEGIIRLLLEKKADVHIVNRRRRRRRCIPPPRFVPIHRRSRLLIQAGSDVNLKTLPSHDGWTPLHGAAAQKQRRHRRGPSEARRRSRAVRDSRELRPLQVAVRGGFDEAANVIRAYAAARSREQQRPRTDRLRAPNRGSACVDRRRGTGQSALERPTGRGRDRLRGGHSQAWVRPLRNDKITDDQGRFAMTGVPAWEQICRSEGRSTRVHDHYGWRTVRHDTKGPA